MSTGTKRRDKPKQSILERNAKAIADADLDVPPICPCPHPVRHCGRYGYPFLLPDLMKGGHCMMRSTMISHPQGMSTSDPQWVDSCCANCPLYRRRGLFERLVLTWVRSTGKAQLLHA